MSFARSAFVVLFLLAAPLPFTGTAAAAGPATVWLDQGAFALGEDQELWATVFDEFGGAVTVADVTLGCDFGCDVAAALQPWPAAISGNGGWGRGAGGQYVFVIQPTQPGWYYLEAALGPEEDRSYGRAYFEVVEASWEIWALDMPEETAIGEEVYVWATLFNNGPVARSFEVELRVDDEWYGYDAGFADAYSLTEIAFMFRPEWEGVVPVTFELANDQVLGPFWLTVVLPARIAAPDVTASPLVTSTIPLVFEEARDLSRATVLVSYDPSIVEVRSIDADLDERFGTLVDHRPEAGEIWISIAAIQAGFTGNFTVANVELAAVELHNTDSTIAFEIWNQERVYGRSFQEPSSAHFHGSILGAAGDNVLRLL